MGRVTGQPVRAERRAASCAGEVISTPSWAATAAASGSHRRPLLRARVAHRPAQSWVEAWRSGVRSENVATFTIGPHLTVARGFGSAGFGLERRPVQPMRASAARSRAVRGWASCSALVAGVRRLLLRWGWAAAVCCRAAISRAAGSAAAVLVVLVVRVICLRL